MSPIYPLREFLHVDDLADALMLIIEKYSQEGHINVGSGHEISIGNLAKLIAEIVGFNGVIEFDDSKPDGTPRKLVEIKKVTSLGWNPKINLREGIESTYEWFRNNI